MTGTDCIYTKATDGTLAITPDEAKRFQAGLARILQSRQDSNFKAVASEGLASCITIPCGDVFVKSSKPCR